MTAPVRVVVTDANVLINLMHVSRLELCGRIPGHEFIVPDHVHAEVIDQRPTLDAAIAAGTLVIASLTNLDALTIFSELIVHVGRGEAACLALAIEHGWTIASDEKRRFHREAVTRVGRERLLGTAEIFVLAIRAGLVTLDEADRDKVLLEQRRFKMPFASFRERA